MRIPVNFRYCLICTIAVILIIAAASFSAIRAFIPHALGYKGDIEIVLSEQLGLPVSIGSLDAQMHWFTPTLVLVDTVIYRENSVSELIHFDEIELGISYIDSFTYMQPMLGEINLVGADIVIERHRDDRWLIQGVTVGSNDGELPIELRALIENANYALLDSHIRWRDYTGQYGAMDLDAVDIIVNNFLGTHTIAASFALPEDYGEGLELIYRFDGAMDETMFEQGEVYLSMRDSRLASLLEYAGQDIGYSLGGRYDMQIWAQLDAGNVTGVDLDLEVDSLEIDREGERIWDALSLSSGFRWRQHNDNWRVYVKDFDFRRDTYNWKEPSDVIVKHQAGGTTISADYIDATSLYAPVKHLAEIEGVSSVSEVLSMLRGGEFFNLHAELPSDDLMQASLSGQFAGLSMVLDGGRRIDGVSGSIEMRGGSGESVLVADAVELVLPDVFDRSLDIERLETTMDFSIQSDQLKLSSPLMMMSLAGADIESSFSIDGEIDGDLTIDARLSSSTMSAARLTELYPAIVMDSDLVRWLNLAITNGRVERADAIFSGNTSDFPFEQDGVFRVDASLRDVDLRFDGDWPALGKLDAELEFDDESLLIRGLDAINFNSRLEYVVAVFEDLGDPILELEGRIRSRADDIQTYIWASPLEETLGDAMRQIEASGPATVDLGLYIPLDERPMKTHGMIRFEGATIDYPVLEYRLHDVVGDLHFEDEQVWSNRLSSKFGREPLKIIIETIEEDRSMETRMRFEGDMDVDVLTSSMDWLPEHWLRGTSRWDIQLDIPHDEENVTVIAESGLIGTELALSDVVFKDQEVSHPLEIRATVQQSLLQIDTKITDTAEAVLVRDDRGGWTAKLDTPLVAGDASFQEGLPVDSTMRFDLERLHLSDLFYTEDGENHSSIMPFTIPSIEFSADNFVWLNWRFHHIDLESSNHPHGMLISKLSLSGDDLEVEGKGSWLNSWRSEHETTLSLEATSIDSGDALVGQGYQRFIDKALYSSTMNLRWPAQPYAFSRDILSGDAKVELENGLVTEIDPGTGGKLLGLFNVFHLPKRLLLDFGDVSRDGFTFDYITGDFELTNGDAVTRNTEINSSAADVRVFGRIDLADELYDLSVRVKPNQSAAAFTGGTIAGGPAVGAGLVLLQKLFDLDDASQSRYVITGGWDEPKIEQISSAQVVRPQTETDQE